MNNLNGKNILIESGGGVGDLIMFTPALRRLKEEYPDCKITFLTIDKTVDVINRIPYIDKVISIKRGRFMGRYRVLPHLLKQDYLIFTEWQPHLLLCAWLLHLPDRYSVGRKGKFLTNTLHKVITHTALSSLNFAAKTNAELLEDALDVNLDGDMEKCDVSLPNQDEKRKVDDLLHDININPNAQYMLISPFASSEERNWPLKNIRMLVKSLEKKYNMPVIIIGNIKRDVSDISRYSLLGKTSIMELIEVIRRAECLITPDSGPMHIAGALNVPCIALFSKDVPSRWAPKNNCWPIYLNYSCSPCPPEQFRNCPYELKCIKDITVDMVLSTMEKVMQQKSL